MFASPWCSNGFLFLTFRFITKLHVLVITFPSSLTTLLVLFLVMIQTSGTFGIDWSCIKITGMFYTVFPSNVVRHFPMDLFTLGNIYPATLGPIECNLCCLSHIFSFAVKQRCSSSPVRETTDGYMMSSIPMIMKRNRVS